MQKLASRFPRKKPDWLHCHAGIPCLAAIQRFWLRDLAAPGCILDGNYKKPTSEKDQVYLDVLTVAVLLRFYGRTEREAELLLCGFSEYANALLRTYGLDEYISYIRGAIQMAKANLLNQYPEAIYIPARSNQMH
jgi:hypothetical protein